MRLFTPVATLLSACRSFNSSRSLQAAASNYDKLLHERDELKAYNAQIKMELKTAQKEIIKMKEAK